MWICTVTGAWKNSAIAIVHLFVLALLQKIYESSCTVTIHPFCFQNHRELINNQLPIYKTKKKMSRFIPTQKEGWKMLHLYGIKMILMMGKVNSKSRGKLPSLTGSEDVTKCNSIMSQ